MKQLSQKAHAAAFHAEFFGNTTQKRYVLGINEFADAVANKAKLDGFIDEYTTATQYRGIPIVKLSDVPAGSMVISVVTQARPKTALNKLQALNGVLSMDYFAVADASHNQLPQVPALADTQKEHTAHPEKFEWVRERFADQESREVFNRVMEFRLNANLRAMRFFNCATDQKRVEFFGEFAPGDVLDPDALEGMKPHILDDHPTLAVAVHHNPVHFWQVPEFILGLRNDYKVYLRHYSEGLTDTVMFFMPV